jgi:uncharacterized protein (TIGR00369 family)
VEPRTDHYPFCWGCSLGTGGLEFDWKLAGDRLEATYVVPDALGGAPGMAHGGIVAALLDEACSQVVCPHLEVRYLSPVPVGETLRISAEVTEAEARRATAEATIQDETGLLLAHARGELVLVRREHFLQTPGGRARGLDWLP